MRDSSIAHRIPDFTLTELKIALSKMKSQGAPGPDNISPSLLKHLGTGALTDLLCIFNASLHSGEIPQMWRNAVIVPVLKAGKPPSQRASFRPISLTSCVMKVMERMLSDRLYDLAETNHWFSDQQAGFRKARGVEDQILRITQRISDGFQLEEKSILVLLDFSKAYDTIWRQRLLLSLSNQGVPPTYILWLSSALLNRQAKVRFNGVLSGSKKMSQGLPQGSVLAPILFLFYINNLAGLLPTDVTTSLYADDVAILASSRSLVEAQQQAQRAVDVVQEWSKGWKINLNGTKSEASTFSMSNADIPWRPSITINNTPIRFEPHPRLLGVILDRKLTFNRQVAAIKEKVTSKLGLLSAVAHSKWGWRKRDLRKVYLAHFQSVLTFASSAWQPWLPDTRITELETVQNKCLRLITGQGKSTPLEALRLEANVPSLASVIKANCIRSREKALRLPANHPRRKALDDVAPQRLKSRGRDFRQSSERWSKDCGLNKTSRRPLNYFNVRPWEKGLPSDIVFCHLEGVSGKGDIPEKIQKAALSRAHAINAEYNIYTDGSASAGMIKGGAGAVVTTGDQLNPVVVTKLLKRGAPLTSSYDEELRAMQMSLDWIDQHLDASKSVAIFTDSQSLCMALVGDGVALDHIRSRLNARPNTVIQWIPGHSGVPGNEIADEIAKQATEEPGPSSPVSYAGACAHIRQYSRDPPPTHPRTKAVYAALSESRECQVGCRAEQTLIAKLRSGHYIGLRATQNRFNPSIPATCNLCGQGDQDLEHWIDCPATTAERWSLFGEFSGGLDCLTRFPREAATLARKTLGENIVHP
jgi:ribonuclease HI